MNQFFAFLKTPYLSNAETSNSKISRLKLLGKAILVYFGLIILIAIVQSLYKHSFNNHLEDLRTVYYDGFGVLKTHLGRWSILFVVLIGPIMEELAFRLGFSFRKKDVLIGIFFLSLYAISLQLSHHQIEVYIKTALFALAFWIVYRYTSNDTLTNFRNKYGAVTLHLFVILFAAIHIGNFDNFNVGSALDYVIFMLPYLVMSYILYYVRIRIGFEYVILLHVTNNLLISLNHSF